MLVLLGIMIPFLGTVIGSSLVFFMKKSINNFISKLLLGFAAGVMVAASIWSLLLPSMEMAEKLGVISWVPAASGFILGILFLLVTNHYFNGLTCFQSKNYCNKFKKILIMILAVTLHNIPEGMAVGVVFAGTISSNSLITLTSAFSLAIGIAIQNFPEGAIISMPLRDRGISRKKSFIYGVLSGIVEPIGAIITIFLTSIVTKMLPYLLSFAAGAMFYVVVDELIPESQIGEHSNYGIIGFMIGFVLMMILDVIFG